MGKDGNEELTTGAVGDGAVAGDQEAKAGGEPAQTGAPESGPAGPELGTTQPDAGAVAEGLSELGLPEGTTLEDVVTLVEKRVRDEYEGPKGHLSQLRSSLESQIADAKRGQAVESQRVLDEALKMAEADPARAIQMMAGQLQSYQQRDMQSLQKTEADRWLGSIIQELELDPDDDDVKQIILQTSTLPPQAAQFEQLGQLSKLSNQRARDAAKGVKAEVEKLKASIPDLVRQQVATLAVASGAKAVDASDPTAPPARDENPIANINSPTKLLQMAYDQERKKGGA